MQSKAELISIIAAENSRGIYHLAANVGGMMIVEGNGKNWNRIDGKYIGTDGYVSTREVSKWAKNNGYSGVVFKNIVDHGPEGFNEVFPTDVYSFFEPQTQIKSADPVTYDDDGNVIPLEERFNETNRDIRYSDRISDQDKLARQNEKLKADVANLRELVKLQGKLTGGKMWTERSLNTAANFIMRETGRELDPAQKKAFTDILGNAYNALSDENVQYEDIIEQCTNAAMWLDENGETQDAIDEYASDILGEMKGIAIRLDETQKAEAIHLFEVL